MHLRHGTDVQGGLALVQCFPTVLHPEEQYYTLDNVTIIFEDLTNITFFSAQGKTAICIHFRVNMPSERIFQDVSYIQTHICS